MVSKEKNVAMTDIKKAIVWGDSVAKGVIYDDSRSRYALSKSSAVKLVAEALGIEIVNRSRMGMTANEGLEMLKKDLDAGMSADVAIIEFGGNDCDFDWRSISETPYDVHLPKTTADIFENKMKMMISEVRAAGMSPYLVTLPPIDAERYFDFISRDGLSKENILEWLGDKNHIYRYHERYSVLISKIAREMGTKVLDVRAAFLGMWNSNRLFCTDGIHPTDEGQRVIADAVLASI